MSLISETLCTFSFLRHSLIGERNNLKCVTGVTDQWTLEYLITEEWTFLKILLFSSYPHRYLPLAERCQFWPVFRNSYELTVKKTSKLEPFRPFLSKLVNLLQFYRFCQVNVRYITKMRIFLAGGGSMSGGFKIPESLKRLTSGGVSCQKQVAAWFGQPWIGRIFGGKK